jgi:hypothetical protein
MHHEGEEVVLIDGRGCWTFYQLHPADRVSAQTLRRHDGAWETLVFVAVGVDAAGRHVWRSHQPAIGPATAPYCELYLPDGWSPPRRRRTVSEQQRRDRTGVLEA